MANLLGVRQAALMVVCVLAAACCGAFQSPQEKYQKEMECASRLTDAKSIEILARGMFCCEPLPKSIQSLPEARRFYLLRASALAPSAPEPYAQIARSYWDEGNYREALAAFEEEGRREPKPVAALIGKVTMLRLLGEWEAGRNVAEELRAQKAIDGEKVADYLEARLLYDEGKCTEAQNLFEKALARSEKSADFLGETPYTMKDAHFYLAQIRRKSGDPLGGHQEFLLYLKKMSDPDFQLAYKYWVSTFGSDQAKLYDTVEKEWAHVRQ